MSWKIHNDHVIRWRKPLQVHTSKSSHLANSIAGLSHVYKTLNGLAPPYLSDDCLLVAEVFDVRDQLMHRHVLYCGPGPSLVTEVLLWLVRGSGTVYRLYCVTLTVAYLHLQKAVEDVFVLVAAAAHSDCFLRGLLTYLYCVQFWGPEVFWTWVSIIPYTSWILMMSMQYALYTSIRSEYCSSPFPRPLSPLVPIPLSLWRWRMASATPDPTVTFPATEHHRPLAGTSLCCLVNRGICVWTTCQVS